MAQDDMPPMMSDSMIDTVRVVQFGSHGSPLIFIPGLGEGGWAWTSSVAHFAPHHVVYVVTLPGFDGTAPPAQKTGYIEQTEIELEKLITTRHIDHPIMVGHSMGGTIALLFATAHSDLIGGVVTISGLPVYPGTEQMAGEHRDDMGTKKIAEMQTEPPSAFHDEVMGEAMAGVMDPETARTLGSRMARSDQFATAQYLGEDLSLDFRGALPKVSVPVLLIVPYNPSDGAHLVPPQSEADKLAYYRSLMQGIPHLEAITISPARHFVMFDQRDAFVRAVAHFVDQTP